MKKLFIAILGVAAFAACSQDVTLETPKGAAIAFDNAFVENATKAADLNANNIKDFGVYGFITNASGEGMIFDNQTVAKSGDAFTYSPAQYWVGGATYSFSALVPKTDAKWTYTATDSTNGSIYFDNAAAVANQDLLFAYDQRKTPGKIESAPEAVAFTFNHVLSRVKFTFKNGFGEGQNITLKVTNVHITNAAANGTLALKNGVLAADWANQAGTLDVDFGDAGAAALAVNATGTTEHFYLIPAEAAYEVTFDVEIFQSGVSVDKYARTATVSIDLERGKSYDFQATLNQNNTSDDGALYPIEFTIDEVEAWADFTTPEVTVPDHVASTADELIEAVKKGGVVALTADINLGAGTRADYGLDLTADVVLDGAGHTLTCSAVRAINVCESAKDVTIKNLVLVAGGERGVNVEGAGKNVTLENVTATATHYTVNLIGSADNCELTINDSKLTGLNVVNIWGEGVNAVLNNTVLNCVDNSAAEGYAAIKICDNANNTTVTVNGGSVNISGSNTEDSLAGVISADHASIVFNSTEGNTTVEGAPFTIKYGSNNYSFSTFAEALETAKDGETIVLTQDLTTDATLVVKEKKVTLDLNGKTLTVTKAGANYIDGIDASTGAELTITGNGTINADWSAVVAMKDAKVVIENGTFYGTEAEVVFVQNSGSVVINGGSYKHTTDPKWTLNQLDKHRETSSILVNGGKFYQFNPANNAAEGEGTNFCAAGKTATLDAEGWYVVE